MSFKDFSVLMSVYHKDSPLFLKEALESIFAQTVAPAEVILVKDGPLTPEIENVIESFKNSLKIISFKENQGLGKALEEGLKACSGALVARMDSDDISLPNRFELQLKEFEKDAALSMCGGYIREIDANTKQHLSIRKVPLKDSGIKKYLKTRNPFNHMTVMFKKEDIIAARGYKPFHLMEDYYLWARLAAQGCKMKNLEDILVNARVDDNMFARRGSRKYFKSNKALYAELLKLGLINRFEYLFNISLRFTVQVLMPPALRKYFYKKALR